MARVSAAIQKQVARDLFPVWGIRATVDAFPRLGDVPPGSWPVIVRSRLDVPGAAGIHLDRKGLPYALVQASRTWSLTASHEILEMLVDPFGNRLSSGPSLQPGGRTARYLVEVCDPCEDGAYAYDVDGIAVSDFYTPRYFDARRTAGARYSRTGALTAPRQLLRGGYLSWQDGATRRWWQATWFGGPRPVFRELGRLVRRKGRSWRETIDGLTAEGTRLKLGRR